jgi:hypothetical protein
MPYFMLIVVADNEGFFLNDLRTIENTIVLGQTIFWE